MAMAENAAAIVAIERLAAAQGCDFHAPLTSSPALAGRARPAARRGADARPRPLSSSDIAAAIAIVRAGDLARAAGVGLPEVCA